MKQIFFTLIIIFISFTIAKSQNITDNDKRSFENTAPIEIDVDGDGEPDKIQPRIYKVEPKNKKEVKLSDVQQWIVFDLKTSKGRKINSFFKYNYGTAEQGGSYWVYALVSAGDVNKDGTTDLIFYSGDDTSDETITLANKGDTFVVLDKKTSSNEDW